MNLSMNQVWKEINKPELNRIVITSHAHPDGDSICSQIALYHLLKELKKEIYIYNNDPVPKQYTFLPDTDKVKTAYNESFNCDLIIVLDVTPWERLGRAQSLKQYDLPILIIDHHLYDTPQEFKGVIDSNAAATAELIYQLYEAGNIKISLESAKHIYTGLLTDTGRFRFSNTASSVMEIAGKMIRIGVNPEKITREVYYNRPVSYINNMAKVLNSIEIYQQKRTLISYFTMDMNNGKAIRMEEAEGFLEVMNSLKDIDLYVFIKEYKKNEFKLSFRSRDPKDARSYASKIGGGGHKHAAGGKMSGSLSDIKMRLYHLLDLL